MQYILCKNHAVSQVYHLAPDTAQRQRRAFTLCRIAIANPDAHASHQQGREPQTRRVSTPPKGHRLCKRCVRVREALQKGKRPRVAGQL